VHIINAAKILMHRRKNNLKYFACLSLSTQSRILFLHSHLSLAEDHLLKFGHSMFGSHWRCNIGNCSKLTLSLPNFFWSWQKWVYQSVQCHTGLTRPFNFWHAGTLVLSHERQSAWMSKNLNGGLDQYVARHFEV